MSLPDKLIDKIRKAASESYEEYSEGFAEFNSEELFKTAYLHGYNCAYNIYDVAEEKIDGMIKDGEHPIKDVPIKSLDVEDGAENFLSNNKEGVSDLDKEALYKSGYEKGFSNAWNTYMDTDFTDELENLTNYYLFGKDNSGNSTV
jgi:hypothetical protein